MARPDRHRAELVAGTARLLRERGYAGTGTVEVLREAGATNGSLYHHFPGGKEDLAVTALEASAARVEALLKDCFARAEPVTAMQAWLDGVIADMAADPDRGCPVGPTAAESPALGDRVRAATAAAFERWRASLAEGLQRHGVPDADDLARVLLSLAEGAMLVDRTCRTTAHLEAVRDAVPSVIDRRTDASGDGAGMTDR